MPDGHSFPEAQVPVHAEGRSALVLALAGLAVSLAGAGAYLGFHSSGAAREVTALRLNLAIAAEVQQAQVSVANFLTTSRAEYLNDHVAALGALTQTAAALDTALAAIETPDRTARDAIRSLEAVLKEWRTEFVDPAIGKRRMKDSRSLTLFQKKGIGARYGREIGTTMDNLTNRIDGSLNSFRRRNAVRKLFALVAFVLGLVGFIAAGASFLRIRQVAHDDLRSRSARLGELAIYADRMHHLVNTDQAAKLLASAVGRHVARAAVLLRVADGTGLRVAATAGTDVTGGPPLPAPGKEPALAAGTDPAVCPVMRTGHRFVIRDPRNEPPCDCPLGASGDGYACIPLQAQARTTGLVSFQPPPGRRLRTPDLDRVEELSRVTSLALTTLVSLEGATHEAVTDQLTGVSNRRFLDGYLAKQFSAALRQGRPLGVLMLDLDKFKSFNDANGHQAGDALLRAAAAVAATCVRDGDLVARYGGEEFAAVLPDADPAGALEIAERIRAAVEGMRVDGLPGLRPPVVTVSIGLAVAPGDGRTVQALVRAADEALYRAKERGRNRIVAASEAPAA